MSDPRYRPRDFTYEPRAFGYATDIRWKEATTDREADLIEASRIQHYFALLIRRRIRDEQIPMNRYVTKAGDTYDRISRILRGTAIMRFEDVARADRILGNIIEEALPEPDHLPD